MLPFIQSPWQIGGLTLPNRLIQAPLAGYSCAPFRRLFNYYQTPAYCVTEMLSAYDVLTKHSANNRYLYRHPDEKILAYQLSGTDPIILQQAALKCEALGADIIDINCGCPKTKIRRKGGGSALLETPDSLFRIIDAIKKSLTIPLTVKIRLHPFSSNIELAQQIANAGADAIIVHGRTYRQDYDIACDWQSIKAIKQAVSIPVIANGDIADITTLNQTIKASQCDAFMIGRAGTGQPWLYKQLLTEQFCQPSLEKRIDILIRHMEGLISLDGEVPALLQNRSLIRYYFKKDELHIPLQQIYQCETLSILRRKLYNGAKFKL